MSDRSTGLGQGVLEETLARLRRRRAGAERPPAAEAAARQRPQDAAFEATVNERLRSLERQLDEVKSRVNGLIFLLAGTVAAQLILRLVG